MTAILIRCPRVRGWLAAFAVAMAGLLAGCSTSASPPAVTLAEAQAEGNAIVAALDAGATIYTSANTTTPAEAAAVESVLRIAEAENAILQGNLTAETAAQAVETAGQDITAVLAVMPIDPVTKVAIDAGIAVLDTFIAEQMAAPAAEESPPHPSLSALKGREGLRPPERVAPPAADPPPVPIPAPHRLPPGIGR